MIIIGATNRLDAVDPALRRAGRFDRELHFAPPHAAARRDILDIHTRHWRPRPRDDTLEHIAQVASGYGGNNIAISVISAGKQLRSEQHHSSLVPLFRCFCYRFRFKSAVFRSCVESAKESVPSSIRK